jgi:CRISPR-associated protein Cst2
MAFITGLYLIDAPASALNNGEAEDIESKVKSIHTRGGDYPYVSAQAFRYWLRTTLEKQFEAWKASPVSSAGAGKKQQAYTAGDPITFYDDDLLGYMRATKEETVTRVSPFRTSTLVSIAPVQIVSDFGVMARIEKQEGDKEGVVLHGHQFYRTTLQGLFSLDLASAGTFTNQMRSGFQNLGKAEIDAAEKKGLQKLVEQKAYRLPVEERIFRVQLLLSALGRIEGGAKQTLHYTDVTPAFVIMAVTRGGNHTFGRTIKPTRDGQPEINEDALRQAFDVFGRDGEILSPIYIGRAEGFMDSARTVLEGLGLAVMHPRQAFDALANDLALHPEWLD